MYKERVISGMRPTGKLHLGNFIGALKTWNELQEKYDCLYMVADLHALTTDYVDTSEIRENIREMVIGWLACGISPEKSIIFKQSLVPEHSQLHLILSMIIPLSWLERNPTYKEMKKELFDKDLSTYGFLGYPVLQAADILIYKGEIVPVGEDQLPHLELSREIARRFNHIYNRNFFPEPKALLSTTSKAPGIDGRKMSKSYGNCIYMADTPEEIKKKVMMMFTDPKKIHANDPGHPDGCVVFAYHKLYSDKIEEIRRECCEGKIGCVPCKGTLAERMSNSLKEIRENIQELRRKPSEIEDILIDGSKKAREIASRTLNEVYEVIKL